MQFQCRIIWNRGGMRIMLECGAMDCGMTLVEAIIFMDLFVKQKPFAVKRNLKSTHSMD